VRALSERGWATLHRLLPGSLKYRQAETRVRERAEFDFAGERFASVSETEPGRFHRCRADDYLTMGAPKNFSAVARCNSLGGNRLTLAGLSWTHGLGLAVRDGGPCATGTQRMGLQFDVDGSAANSERIFRMNGTRHILNWKIAGGAGRPFAGADSDALGFTDRVNGFAPLQQLHFRGNLAEAGPRQPRRCGVN